MDFSLQKEVEIYRMNNCSFWKVESEMQKTEIQKNEVQSSLKDEMARQILSVTEILIAEIGIQNLSMRKIATRANLALGTLYLYFKTKDDLLNKLAYDLCDRFTHYVQDGYDETDTLFNRYRCLKTSWHFCEITQRSQRIYRNTKQCLDSMKLLSD